MRYLLFFLLLVIPAACGAYDVTKEENQSEKPLPLTQESPQLPEIVTNPKVSDLSVPIDNFASGQTMKKFGQFITPETSSVQPEKFTGYHSGVDIEVAQDETDVPVYALADGTVLFVGRVNGYGGVIILQFSYEDQDYTALYGHLRLSSVTAKIGDDVTRGQKLAVLGSPNSEETDGERKHLHFAIHAGTALEFRGYVQSSAELSGWRDPDEIFR